MKPTKIPVQKLVGIGSLLLLLVPTAWARSTLPFYEPFGEYNQNENLGSIVPPDTSGITWDYGDSVTAINPRITTNAALFILGIPGDTNTAPKGIQANGTGKNQGLIFTAQTSGSVYASFLFEITTNNATSFPRITACLSSSTTSAIPNPAASVYVNQFGQLTICKSLNAQTSPPGDAPWSSSLVVSNTYMLVMRYTFNPTATNDDEVALWINPTPLGDDNNVPAPMLTYSTGNDVSIVQTFGIMAPTAAPVMGFNMDEIRIATNWAGVTPIGCSPSATFNVTGGGTGCTGQSFDVGLDGSETDCDYWLVKDGLYAGTTLSGTGSALDFGAQVTNGVYTVLATNRTTSCFGWMAGSATVQIYTSPIIAVQPQPTIVATNGQCTISVIATGGDLTFQWRRNGTNLNDSTPHISGSTSSNLTIYPATTADAAPQANGYDCVITGSCTPPTNSSRVGLTLGSPTTLYWVGYDPMENANFSWDVVTSTNWTTSDGSGATRGFTFGDNVHFTDGAQGLLVNVNSPFLSPSSVTINTFEAYGFYGNGSIIGPGTLVAIGTASTASLSITNANSYTGGSIISNILVNIVNNTALGMGPITLKNGAKLSTYGTRELPNAINLGSNATIQVNTTSPLILDGSLSGTGIILGSVAISSSGTLSPGDSSIGTLTITNALTLQSGSTNYMQVNKTAGTNDLMTGLASVTYGGTLVVTNLAGTLTTNDAFKIFDATSYSGAFASVTPAPGMNLLWNTNTLTTDGTLRITNGTVALPPTVIHITTASVQIQSGTNFVFGGTSDATGGGYSVLSSTNLAQTNWVLESTGSFSGSGAFNVTNNMKPGDTKKFLRLRVP